MSPNPSLCDSAPSRHHYQLSSFTPWTQLHCSINVRIFWVLAIGGKWLGSVSACCFPSLIHHRSFLGQAIHSPGFQHQRKKKGKGWKKQQMIFYHKEPFCWAGPIKKIGLGLKGTLQEMLLGFPFLLFHSVRIWGKVWMGDLGCWWGLYGLKSFVSLFWKWYW